MATGVRIAINHEEFSRLEHDRKDVVATIAPEPRILPLAERFRVDLIKARRRRDAVVASITLAFPAGDTRNGLPAAFDLSTLVDTDGHPAVRRGAYFLRVTALDTPGLVVDSLDLAIRLVTAHRLGQDYLHGLAKLPADTLAPKYQPRAITGLEIIEVEPNTQPAFYPLTLNVDPAGSRTLQWAGGRTIALDPRFRRFVLPDNRDGYVEVEIADPSVLPPGSTEEVILIERARLDTAAMGRFIDRASDWLEHTMLQLFLEPTILTTERGAIPHVDSALDPATPPLDLDHDVVVPPLTLYVPPAAKWTGVRFPYAHTTRVFALVGELAGAPVLGIPPSWIQLQPQIGFAQLVPSHQPAALALLAYLAIDALHGAVELPGFWHFAIRAGLPSVPGDIIEAIAKKAALDALTVLGQAFKPGIASESFSKEISVSTSYVRNAQANLLAASRSEYKADLDTLIPRLKSRYLGLANVAIV